MEERDYKREITLKGSKIAKGILHRVREGVNIELVGTEDSLELDQQANEIAEALRGVAERFDHPGCSHIRVVRVPLANPTGVSSHEGNNLDKFEASLRDAGVI